MPTAELLDTVDEETRDLLPEYQIQKARRKYLAGTPGGKGGQWMPGTEGATAAIESGLRELEDATLADGHEDIANDFDMDPKEIVSPPFRGPGEPIDIVAEVSGLPEETRRAVDRAMVDVDETDWPVEEVEMDSLYHTQFWVVRSAVRDYVKDLNKPSTYMDDRPSMRPLVARFQGRHYILNGHHRLSALKFRGGSRARVHLMDLDAKLGIRKYNPNHYPAGTAGGRGGQFAPREGAGDAVDVTTMAGGPTQFDYRNVHHAGDSLARANALTRAGIYVRSYEEAQRLPGKSAAYYYYASKRVYKSVNNYLRHKEKPQIDLGDMEWAGRLENIAGTVKELDAFVKTSTIHGKDLMVYRGLDGHISDSSDPRSPKWTELVEGAVFTDKGFVSTSPSPSVAMDFTTGATGGTLARIRLPKGMKVGLPETTVPRGGSNFAEVLLPRGLKFKVVKRSKVRAANGRNTIYTLLDLEIIK